MEPLGIVKESKTRPPFFTLTEASLDRDDRLVRPAIRVSGGLWRESQSAAVIQGNATNRKQDNQRQVFHVHIVSLRGNFRMARGPGRPEFVEMFNF
jgi:hypothetical protein